MEGGRIKIVVGEAIFPSAKFVSALARLSQAHAALGEQPDWLQPKGVGVVCVKKDGIKSDSFVHFYFGKMCDIGHFSAFTRSARSISQSSPTVIRRQNGWNAKMQCKSSR